MKRMIHVCLMLLTLGVASAVTAPASSKQPKPTGMFSDMEYNDEGGDLLGTEVFITYAHDGYFVVYQSSEGEPITPVVVPATISGTSIKFVVPEAADPRGSFSGTIGAKELIGSFSGSKEIIHLKRKASYWQ
jgi:alkylation response protein AidB-like acyl-CoA dehydrogenase